MDLPMCSTIISEPTRRWYNMPGFTARTWEQNNNNNKISRFLRYVPIVCYLVKSIKFVIRDYLTSSFRAIEVALKGGRTGYR